MRILLLAFLLAALPAATVDPAGDSAVSSPEPGAETSPAEAGPAASESGFALADATTPAAETTVEAPTEKAPPVETVSRGTVPDETR